MASTEDSDKAEVSTSSDVFETPIALGYHEGPLEATVSVGPPLVLSPENMNSYSDLNTSAYFVKKDVYDDQAVKGRCGLYNLGNTCFMNSGVQCLMSNIPLIKFLLTYYQTNKEFDVTLLGQFKKLFVKIWSGRYSILHPTDFKNTLGVYHPQFQDYRQHDCQEFLALLLDTLHEQLNFRHQSSNQIIGAGPSGSKQPIKFEHNIIYKSTTNQEHADIDQSKKVSHSNLTIENDIKIAGGGCVSSSVLMKRDLKNVIQCSVAQTSEDSNHSNISEQSSDSEQCSVIKNLKLRSSPVAGSSSHMEQDGIASSSDDINERLGNKQTDENDSFMKRAESLQDLKGKEVINIPGKLPKSSSDMDLVKKAGLSEDSSASPPAFSSTPFSLDTHVDMKGDILERGETVEIPVESQSDPVILNNAVPASCVPSLDDLYAKETKTLNTNVLATEYMSENVTTDSDKFAKTDNIAIGQEFSDVLEEGMVHNAIGVPCKNDGYKPSKIKDVNIRVDKKSRSPKGAIGSGEILSAEKEDCFLLTNVKRMKFEGTEKNLQMQEMSKIQKSKIDFGEKAVKCSNKNINSLPRTDDVLNGTGEESDGESEIMEDQDMDVDMEVSDVDQCDPSDREECVSATGQNITTVDVLAAEEAWHKYLMKNDSIIVDTFQGQFKSTVVCGKCSQVSVTFEPFMYLSVPIPHAMERQLCVILISNDRPPTKYLLTLHKQDRIQKVKEELRKVLQHNTQEIVIAEVLNHHISRILEDNTMLRYINDSSRMIYAFEMDPSAIEDINEVDLSPSDAQTFNNSTTTMENKPNSDGDVFSQMGSFNADSGMYLGQQYDVAATGMGNENLSSTSQNNQNLYGTDVNNIDMAGTGLWEWNQPSGSEGRRGSLETETGDTWPIVDSTTSENLCDEVDQSRKLMAEEENIVSSTSASSMTITVQWNTCAICLEELTDAELMVHTACGGTFCPTCLEMSVQHYRDSSYCCPVCSSPAELTEDFVPLVDAANHKPKTRIVSIPVSFRCDQDVTGAGNPFMFAHPRLLNLPSNLTGEVAYSIVEKLIPFQWEFQILLTDGQGLHCSRCLYMEHCSGCVISRDGEVVIRPSDNLTISVTMVTMEELDLIGHVIEHESMKHQRSNDPVTLTDCFTAFTESEELDEHNPWFCPHCKENQQAKKTMTVWRYPDSLIIHLKRFLFHELSSTKVDNKVVFPLDTLDLEEFVSGPRTKNLSYRLYSLVCHFGGANSGHYTAYSRHPVDDQWYYYNDETVNLQSPGEDEYSSTYVLFYQRKGTEETLHIPEEIDLGPCEDDSSDLVTSMPTVTYQPPEGELTLTLNLPASDELTPCQSSSSLSVTASAGLLNIASSSEDSVADNKKEHEHVEEVDSNSEGRKAHTKTEFVEADSTDSPYDFYS